MRCSLCVLLLLFFCRASGASSEFLRNGSFDEFSSNEIALGWRDNSAWADLSVEYHKDSGRTAGWSQHIICKDYHAGAVQFVQASKSIEKDKIYQVEFWVRGRLESPLKVLLRERGGGYRIYAIQEVKVAADWRKFQLRLMPKKTDDNAYFMFQFFGVGELWFDDVSVRVLDDAPSEALRPGYNVVRNPGFEVGMNHWGVRFREKNKSVSELQVAEQATAEVKGGQGGDGYFLSVKASDGARYRISSDYIKAQAGAEYVLSFKARTTSRHTVNVGLSSGDFGRQSQVVKGFPLTAGWQQYRHRFILPKSATNDWVLWFEGQVAGTHDFDSISLSAGEPDVTPSDNLIAIGIDANRNDRLYRPDELVSLTLRTSGQIEEGDEVTVNAVDYYGGVTRVGMWNLSGDGVREWKFEPALPGMGFFRLTASIKREGEVIAESSIAIGRLITVTSGSRLDTPFGGHDHLSTVELDKLERLGAKWIRLHPPNTTKWWVVEPRPGEWNFDVELLKQAKQAGFSFLGILGGPPAWASSAPKSDIKNASAYPPRTLESWERYVSATVGAYRGIIDHWEVWNEPDSGGFFKLPGSDAWERKAEKYVELLAVAYRAAKQANPEAMILGVGASHAPPVRWTSAVLKAGGYPYFDILSFHSYPHGKRFNAADSMVGKYIDDLVAVLSANGQPLKPIWETESGVEQSVPMFTHGDDENFKQGYDDDETVQYVIGKYLTLLQKGVERWFYYSLGSAHRPDRRLGYSLFEWEGSPRPAAIAYGVLSAMLNGTHFSEADEPLEGVKRFGFRGEGRTVNVWLPVSGKTASCVPATHDTEAFGVMGDIRHPIACKEGRGFPLSNGAVYQVQVQ